MQRIAFCVLTFACFVAFSSCSDDDSPTSDAVKQLDGSTPKDINTSPDEGALDSSETTCGGEICAAGYACCGPSECGYCVPENSGAYCPPTCPDAGTGACGETPTGFCDPEQATSCVDGVKVCACVAVCSGVRPRPGEEYEWRCESPPHPTCPATAPNQGTPCDDEGISCDYGVCDETAAKCEGGFWLVSHQPPPP